METLQDTLFKVEVRETEHSVFYWANLEGFSKDTQSLLLAAEILLVPWDFRRPTNDAPTFADGTGVFFQALQEKLDAGVVAIASNPDSYFELDLHSDKLRLTKVVVKQSILTVFLGVLASLIAEQIKSPKPPKTVEMVLVVDNQQGKCINIDYKGPPGDMVKTFEEAINKCLPNDITDGERKPQAIDDVDNPSASKKTKPQHNSKLGNETLPKSTTVNSVHD